jgi:hypothetical protein
MCAKGALKWAAGVILQYNFEYLAMLCLALSQGSFSCKHAGDAHYPLDLSLVTTLAWHPFVTM